VDRRAASLVAATRHPATDWQQLRSNGAATTGAEQREQWVGTHRCSRTGVNQSWRIAARLNHADTDDHLHAAAGARLVEGNLGFAYRPWNHTRWALFGRYTWLYDLATLGAARRCASCRPEDAGAVLRRRVCARRPLGIRGQAGAPHSAMCATARGTGPWFDSGTDFAAAQVRYGLRSHWHALVEYRWQAGRPRRRATRTSWPGVDRDIGPHLRLGAGYNFTDFSDDLTEFGRGHRGWFLDISGRY
jgi:hypothetical protein